MKINFLFLLMIFLVSCAYVHHVQVGEVASHKEYVSVPFELLVSEVGFNVQEAGKLGRAVLQDKKAGRDVETIAALISLFQMGPRTGNPVWSGDGYADKLYVELYEKCSSGQVTGLQSIRETNKYPAISGEIVKIRGICLKKKTQSVGKNI